MHRRSNLKNLAARRAASTWRRTVAAAAVSLLAVSSWAPTAAWAKPRMPDDEPKSPAHGPSHGSGRGQAKGGGPWSLLQAAATHVRVGQLPDAAAPLERLFDGKGPSDKDAAAVGHYLRARVLASAGKGADAAAALKLAAPIQALAPAAFAFVEIEVDLAAGNKARAFERLDALRSRWSKFRWAQADLTWSRLYEELGPPEKAADAALDLYGKSHLHLPQDELLARAARCLHKAGKLERAHMLWKKLVLKHPESDFIDEAVRHVPLDTLSVAERLDRAELLFKRRDYERCRAESLVLWQLDKHRDIVGYFLGKIGSERLRDDYPGAATYFEGAIGPNAPYALQALSSYGIVLGKLGRIDDAVAAFDAWMKRFAGSADSKRVNELMYDRCRALHIAGRSLQAAEEYGAWLQAHRSGFDWGKYWWFVAFWNYQGGAYDKAIEQLGLLRAAHNPLVGGKARYWTAKAYEKLGKLDTATKMMAQLSQDMPLTWYAGLAENWLVDHNKGSLIPKRPDLSKVPWRTPDPFAGLPNDGAVRKLRIAAHLGEYDTLRDVWDDQKAAVAKQIGKAKAAALESALSDGMEDVAADRSAALHRWGGDLRRWPTRDNVQHWRGIYPRAYATHTAWAAKRYGAPEWMVYAHMLQESRYKPWMISGAPAYGLLELLDRTARRLANERKEDYQLWMLMVPGPNIRWGTQYLGALVAKFHGQLPFAIASYNGGPMLLEYHLAESAAKDGKPAMDFDMMIDNMGPHECRNYVRMVVGHFLRYIAIYETPKRAAELRAALLPRTWRAEWLPNPNY